MKSHAISIMILMFILTAGPVFAQDTIPANRENRENNLEVNQEDREKDKDEVVDREKRQKIIADAEEAKRKFKERSPNVEGMFDTSAGYAIFPNVGKGAYILGGAAGNGVVYEGEKMVGFAELRQIDIGLQLGGQAFSQIIFFETDEELNRFKEGNFEFGGNASAVIIEKGRAESINFNDGIAVATMPKAGAMVEISIGGQKFNYGDIE